MKSVVDGRVVEGRVESSKWVSRGVVEMEVSALDGDVLREYWYEVPTDEEFALTSAGKRVRVTVEEVDG